MYHARNQQVLKRNAVVLLKLAAVQVGVSMHTFIRDAIKEKILREHAAASLHASSADDNASAVLAKANEKPA